MRIGLIFPPQWDPRQPPLCIPTLAGALKGERHDVRAWDVNLALYRSILFEQPRGAKSQRLIKEYFNPDTLGDHDRFGEISDRVENLINTGYNRYEPHWLCWDHFDAGFSPDVSRHWRLAVKKPKAFPFYRRMRSLIREVAQWMPELVCISINSDTQIFGGLSFAAGIRSELPEGKIVIGGQALRARRHLLVRHDWLFETVDAIGISHGEPSLVALAQGMALAKVPNILWHDGRTVQTPKKLEPVCFQTGYEPDFSVVRLDQYLSPRTVIPVETAKGCPWSRCSFCGHPGIELSCKRSYVPRPLSSVLREVQRHVSKGYSRFFFIDEAIPYDRFRALSTGLAKVKGDLSWICYIRPEHMHNASVFRIARRSGCLKVFIGVETGSGRLMRLHRIGTTPKIAKRVILDASEAGLAIHLFLIAEFPDESKADIEATDEFLKDVLPAVDAFGFTYDVFQLTAELGTPLYEQPRMFGAGCFRRRVKSDLQYDFQMTPTDTGQFLPHAKHEKRVGSVIERCMKHQNGLRQIESIDDSTHLLLIEKYLLARGRKSLSMAGAQKKTSGGLRK
jgi:hypothetical protein